MPDDAARLPDGSGRSGHLYRRLQALWAFLRRRIVSLTWCNARSCGNSRIIRTSVLFLVLVPIAAHFLTPFAGRHDIPVPWREAPVVINVALPFNLFVFYLAAVFFFVAQTTYAFRCPEIIKKFQSFEDLRRVHRGMVVLSRWLRRAIDGLPLEALEELVNDLAGALRIATRRRETVYEKLQEIRETSDDSEQRRQLWESLADSLLRLPPEHSSVADAFDLIADGASRLNPVAMRCSILFFSIGFILFGVVLVQNFITVIRIAFP